MTEQDINIIQEPYILPDATSLEVHAVMKENVDNLVSVFKVLSDPVRIRILKALQVTELCVCVLVEITDYKHSALSYHLKLLKDADLVDSRRDKNFQIYYLTETGDKLLRSIDSSFKKGI
ncbi:MAG: ArsR family transcriptional regulator, lead/cadmium/zinc/bismuth-responsive transcriptional [Methanolobus sp.]|jgi:DNA-binding transcriptional ArsR family regulator|nr:ArsR family transcriptional regulator, lead/cadmium/zinc/bismuth-responsive transcriptional [Methanolobus sp.]MDK2947618.1 ArsR family transcriptional regulator, lead/cadmium/zinc/bismuth-responsive transcriptional [Methanolobus sp.]